MANVVTVVTETELHTCVDADQTGLGVIQEGFRHLGEGKVTIPPILGLEMPDRNGAADVKTAYLPDWDSFAVKISTRFFDNSRIGLPNAGGLMVLLSSLTGQVQALLLDNGYLTTVRTALAGALAARYLAPERVRTVAVIGAGSQARWQLQALRLVRSFQRVICYARSADEARDFADRQSRELGLGVEAADSAEEAVAPAQVIITTTPATHPVLRADWINPGTHVTAMGSDAPHKNEIDPELIKRADLFVCDLRSQSLARGELRHAVAAGVIREDADIAELGQLVTGSRRGRVDDAQITVCDLTGVGVQDTAIARHALAQCKLRGLGQSVG